MTIDQDRLREDPAYFLETFTPIIIQPWQREALRAILNQPSPACNCHERDSTYHHLCPLCGPEMREEGLEDPA